MIAIVFQIRRIWPDQPYPPDRFQQITIAAASPSDVLQSDEEGGEEDEEHQMSFNPMKKEEKKMKRKRKMTRERELFLHLLHLFLLKRKAWARKKQGKCRKLLSNAVLNVRKYRRNLSPPKVVTTRTNS